jgi:hypothetical protein
MVDHGREVDLWAHPRRPPGRQGKADIHAKMVVQALDANLRVLLQRLRLLATSIPLEAVDGPIAIWGKIDFPITALIRQGQKGLEACGCPEPIFAVSVLGAIL